MFPILNVSNNKGFNQMSSLKQEIDAMTPEQVMAELPLIFVWILFGSGILYLIFGM